MFPEYNLLWNMIRKLTFVLLMVLSLPTVYFTHKLVSNYGVHFLNQFKADYDPHASDHIETKLTLENLIQLSSIPIVGRFFVENKLRVLAKQRRWTEILSQLTWTEGVFSTKNGRQLLIYRALAECATFQFVKCERTVREIEEKVPHLYNTVALLDPNHRRDRLSEYSAFEQNSTIEI